MTTPKPRARTIYFAISLFTLLCGTAIYPLFRGPNLLVWGILPKPAFWGSWQMPYPNEGLTSVLIGSGPDCLWFLSGICALRGLWFHELKMQKIYLTVFYFIALGYNLGQYLRIIPGTFDFFDLLTMSGVALAEVIIWSFFIKGERYESF